MTSSRSIRLASDCICSTSSTCCLSLFGDSFADPERMFAAVYDGYTDVIHSHG